MTATNEDNQKLVELLQVLALTNKGYVIFDSEDQCTEFVKNAAIDTMCKVVEGMADVWELESLKDENNTLTFQTALLGMRNAVKAWQSEKS